MEFDAEAAIQAVISQKTDLERAEEARYQAEQRAKLRLPSDLEMKVEMGRRMTKTAMRMLAVAESDDAYSRLAEGLALQGEYRQAAALAPKASQKEEYQKVVDAIDNPHDCGCPLLMNRLPTRFTKEKIIAEGRQTQITACSLCGHIRC